MCLMFLFLAVPHVPGHTWSLMTQLISFSSMVLLLSLEVSLCSSLTHLAALLFFFLHSLDMLKWPFSPQVLHVLSSAGHFYPALCLA